VLSVWRKPIDIYISSSFVVIKNGLTCKVFERSPTHPLSAALEVLNEPICEMKLGKFRRASVYLSAALWPADHEAMLASTPTGSLKVIESWLMRLSILPTRISPLWAIAPQLGIMQSENPDVLLLCEADANTGIQKLADGSLRLQTQDPAELDDLFLSEPNRSTPKYSRSLVKVEFMTTPTPEGLPDQLWSQHWRQI
jgi:hypothetical protein